MGIPVIVALNMVDVAKNRGLVIDTKILAKELGCPVVALECNKGIGIEDLKKTMVQPLTKSLSRHHLFLTYPSQLTKTIDTLTQKIIQKNPIDNDHAHWFAIRLLEEDLYARKRFTQDNEIIQISKELQHILKTELGEEADILIADARFGFIHKIAY